MATLVEYKINGMVVYRAWDIYFYDEDNRYIHEEIFSSDGRKPRDSWCSCNGGKDPENMGYYHKQYTDTEKDEIIGTAHGWYCLDCLSIVQTG